MADFPTLIVKVKLPSSSGYACCPSGDSDYEDDYAKAINEAIPTGFRVAWKDRDSWVRDRDGFTWVTLILQDEKVAIAYWMDKCKQLETKLDSITSTLSSLVKFVK